MFISNYSEETVKNTKKGEISELIVMSSAAGWYLGRIQIDSDIGFPMPYERCSDYMTEAEAIHLHEGELHV